MTSVGDPRKTGRPPRPPVECCRTAYMFYVLQKSSGLSLRQLTREYAKTSHIRGSESAVYQRIRGYAGGTRLPLADKDRLLTWAVDLHSPCAVAYQHIVWNVIEALDQRLLIWDRWDSFRRALPERTRAATEGTRSAADSFYSNFPLFSIAELERVAQIDDLDALAVLLIPACCRFLGEADNPGPAIEICRSWLARWHLTREGEAMRTPLRRALIKHVPHVEVLHI